MFIDYCEKPVTENDWVLHLDEESVIDDLSVQRCLEFIRFETDYHFGQGVILYNQYRFWRNPIFTVADGVSFPYLLQKGRI